MKKKEISITSYLKGSLVVILAFLIGFEFYPANAFDVGLRFANGVKNIIANPDDPDLNGVTDARTYSIQFYFAFNLGKKAK